MTVPQPHSGDVTFVVAGDDSELTTAVRLLVKHDLRCGCQPLSDAIGQWTRPRAGIVIAQDPEREREALCRNALALLALDACAGLLVIRRPLNEDEVSWANGLLLCSVSESLEVADFDARAVLAGCRRLRDNIGSMEINAAHLRNRRLKLTIQADAVYACIKRYSHGMGSDINDRLLAPARLLVNAVERERNRDKREALVTTLKDLWTRTGPQILRDEDFAKQIGALGDHSLCGDLGLAICGAIQALPASLDGVSMNKNGLTALSFHLSNLMELFTEARMLSGSKTDHRTLVRSVSHVRTRPPPKTQWRILVIDDHVENWIPVFNTVRQRFECNEETLDIDVSVGIDSGDGDDAVGFPIDDFLSRTNGRSLRRYLPEYDLVLLDVFLGRTGRTGIKFLREMRERRIYVPVVLWTTSIDKDLPAEAVLANGYLYKKETSIDDIVSAVRDWLELGRGKHEMPLLHPFFSHVIVSPVHRQLAKELTHWCLKLADSFHAVDSTFFRYFNDHGGRHVWGVLAMLEHLLTPFLMDCSYVVVPKDAESFEDEVFSLYLAAVCHDLGMFPTERERRTITKAREREKMKALRVEHSTRALNLLMGMPPYVVRGKPDDDFRELLSILKNIGHRLENDARGKRILARAAMLAGCHAAPLASMKEPAFLRTYSEVTSIIHMRDIRNGFRTLRSPVGTKLVDGKKANERLRRQCAIFRLADALDVDWTRVPAEFLLGDSKRNMADDPENLKRQVLNSVGINAGSVTITFRGPAPSEIDIKRFFTVLNGTVVEDLRRFVTKHYVALKQAPISFFQGVDTDACPAFAPVMQGFCSLGVEVKQQHIVVAAWVSALWVCLDLVKAFRVLNEVGLAQKGWISLQEVSFNGGTSVSELKTQLSVLCNKGAETRYCRKGSRPRPTARQFLPETGLTRSQTL